MNIQGEARDYVLATVLTFRKETHKGLARLDDRTQLTFSAETAVEGTTEEDAVVGQEIMVHLGADGRRRVIDAWKSVH